MNLPKDNSVISEDELQAVMAGISEMTEEFSKQESIIESMVEIKFGDILKGNIQGNTKAYDICPSAKPALSHLVITSTNSSVMSASSKESHLMVVLNVQTVGNLNTCKNKCAGYSPKSSQ